MRRAHTPPLIRLGVIALTLIMVFLSPAASAAQVGIGGGNAITSTITVDAVDRLRFQPQSDVVAIIRASSVMLGISG